MPNRIDDLNQNTESKTKEEKPNKKEKKEKDSGFSEATAKFKSNELQIKSGDKSEGASGRSRRKAEKTGLKKGMTEQI